MEAEPGKASVVEVKTEDMAVKIADVFSFFIEV